MRKNSVGFLRHFITKNTFPPEQGSKTSFWPREMKIAKDLYAKFPDKSFWDSIKIGFKVHSLAFFNTKRGEDLLTLKYREFHFKPENKENLLPLSDGKFGETVHNSKAPKTVRDFLI